MIPKTSSPPTSQVFTHALQAEADAEPNAAEERFNAIVDRFVRPALPGYTTMEPTFTEDKTATTLADANRRIRAGLLNGSITKDEGARLARQSDVLATNKPDARQNESLAQLERAVGDAERNQLYDVGQQVLVGFSRIADGVKDGTLTESEATELKAQLGDLACASTPSAGRLEDSNPLGAFLKTIHAKRINTIIEPDKVIAHNEQRIGRGLVDGTLTTEEATALRGSNEALRAALGQPGATPDGTLQSLVSLRKHITEERKDSTVDFGKRVQTVMSRVDAAAKRGSVVGVEVDLLKARALKAFISHTWAQSPEARDSANTELTALMGSISSANLIRG